MYHPYFIILIWNSTLLQSAFQNFIFSFKFCGLQEAWNKIHSIAWRQRHTAEHGFYTFRMLAQLCTAIARPFNAASSAQCAGRDHLEKYPLTSWGSCASQSLERDRLNILSYLLWGTQADALLRRKLRNICDQGSLYGRIFYKPGFSFWHSVVWDDVCLGSLSLQTRAYPGPVTCMRTHPSELPVTGSEARFSAGGKAGLCTSWRGWNLHRQSLVSSWRFRTLKCFCFSAAWRNCIAHGGTCWAGGSSSLPPEKWGPGWCPSQGRCSAYNFFCFLLFKT